MVPAIIPLVLGCFEPSFKIGYKLKLGRGKQALRLAPIACNLETATLKFANSEDFREDSKTQHPHLTLNTCSLYIAQCPSESHIDSADVLLPGIIIIIIQLKCDSITNKTTPWTKWIIYIFYWKAHWGG